MICEKCKEEGKRSTVSRDFGTISTDMAFYPDWDEEGVYHYHDGNISTSSFRCSNEHRFTVRQHGSICGAPGCDWNSKVKTEITYD
jgi:hypothetical protein